ncbi:MAG: heme-degrading monooxygenase HmoA [Flavobacteriales bacterium]|jgi:heme-degrading monooxygenase HmoA
MIRIVKLTFATENIPTFLEVFEQTKSRIRGFEGCERLELLSDRNNPEIYFTYSWWDKEESLANYRSSEFFQGVWAKTKPLFAAQAEAWSVDQKDLLI